MEKNTLNAEMETLLITLYGKAVISRRADSLLPDPKAEEIVESIDYDFSRLKIAEKTNLMMAMRAKEFDRYTRDFLTRRPDALVLHLGCGLDSRYLRIGPDSATWYDLDFPQVMELKKRFFNESENYRMVGASVTDPAWIEDLPARDDDVLVLAEGLFMYLHEQEVVNLLETLREKYAKIRLNFDGFSKMTARNVKYNPSLRKTGASVHWGIDSPDELEALVPAVRFVEDWAFTDSRDIEKLSGFNRFMFRFAGRFKAARNAHRIFVFDIGS